LVLLYLNADVSEVQASSIFRVKMEATTLPNPRSVRNNNRKFDQQRNLR
jgi:hypothetical protein